MRIFLFYLIILPHFLRFVYIFLKKYDKKTEKLCPFMNFHLYVFNKSRKVYHFGGRSSSDQLVLVAPRIPHHEGAKSAREHDLILKHTILDKHLNKGFAPALFCHKRNYFLNRPSIFKPIRLDVFPHTALFQGSVFNFSLPATKHTGLTQGQHYCPLL